MIPICAQYIFATAQLTLTQFLFLTYVYWFGLKFFEILSVIALLLPLKSVLLKWDRPSSNTCISVKLALRAFEKKKKNSTVDNYKNSLDTFSIEVEQIFCT